MKQKRYIKTRNFVAVAARFRQAGSHGGTPRQNNKRDRKASRQELRDDR